MRTACGVLPVAARVLVASHRRNNIPVLLFLGSDFLSSTLHLTCTVLIDVRVDANRLDYEQEYAAAGKPSKQTFQHYTAPV